MKLHLAEPIMLRNFSKTKLTILEYFFDFFIVSMFLVLLFVSLALGLYPEYSCLRTGFCDLRVVTEINGESTLISTMLLRTSVILLFVVLMMFFSVIMIFFQGKANTKYLSWIGTFFGLSQGPINIIIFFERGTFEFHMIFVIMGPILLNLAIIIYTIIYFLDGRVPKLNKYSFLVLAISAIVFSIIIGIANSIGGSFNAQTQRLGNTLFNYLSGITFIIQGIVFFLITKKVKTTLDYK